MKLGSKSRFAFEVGEFWPPNDSNRRLRRVDLWAAEQWLTCEVNTVFIPAFCLSVERTIDWLRGAPDLGLPDPSSSPEQNHERLRHLDDGSDERFWFLRWGPTTDNVSGYLFNLQTITFSPLSFGGKETTSPNIPGKFSPPPFQARS
ncbi:MAG: hypothetical protein AAF585_17720 [Verrucomicrobiota bacterium]